MNTLNNTQSCYYLKLYYTEIGLFIVMDLETVWCAVDQVHGKRARSFWEIVDHIELLLAKLRSDGH